MIIVSDTSVIINLAWINHLDLLERLYQEIIIPPAVWNEIVINGKGKPGASEVQSASWIKVQTPENANLILSLQQTLDLGEAEPIALAIEMSADLLLMDERIGRATASQFNLKFLGLIGVLIVAKQNQLITTVRPLLDQLRNIAGFHISQPLYLRVLQTVNE